MAHSADKLSGQPSGQPNRSDLSVPGSPVASANGSGSPSLTRLGTDHFCCRVAVVNEMGMHARPATQFVTISNKYPCEVHIRKGDEQVDGKSIMQLLTLSAEQGTLLELETRGGQAEEALRSLVELVAAGFHEMNQS